MSIGHPIHPDSSGIVPKPWRVSDDLDIDLNGHSVPDGLPQAAGYVGTTQADPGAIYGDASDIPGYSQELNGLPSGLLCRDLRDRGYGYEQAYTYWELWGRPDNMDIDLNGTPCETVWAYNERNYEN